MHLAFLLVVLVVLVVVWFGLGLFVCLLCVCVCFADLVLKCIVSFFKLLFNSITSLKMCQCFLRQSLRNLLFPLITV